MASSFCRSAFSIALFGLVAFFLVTTGWAGEGKLDALGPLKLGLSEQDATARFGNLKDFGIKFLGRDYYAQAEIKDEKISSYWLQSPAPSNRTECGTQIDSVQLNLNRYFAGKPDSSEILGGGPPAFRKEVRWLFNNSTILLTATYTASSKEGTGCFMTIIFSAFGPPEMTVVPNRK